eukprot:g32019.t1
MGSAATSTVAQTEEGEFVLVPQPRNERLRRSQPPFQGLGFEQKAGRALCFPAMYVIEATWKFPGRSWSNDVLMLSGGAARRRLDPRFSWMRCSESGGRKKTAWRMQ